MRAAQLHVLPQRICAPSAMLHDLENRLQRITGIDQRKSLSLSGRLTPSTYLEASVDAANRSRSKNSESYIAFLEFIHRVRSAINAFATRLQAASSERTYLSALIDVLALRPSAVTRGNFRVRLSAREAEEYVGLSSSSCTAARRGLVDKGLIEIDGDSIDLSPFIETLQPYLTAESDDADISRKIAGAQDSSAPLPKNTIPPSNISTVSLKKETITMVDSGDLFSREAIKEAISLSPKLLAELNQVLDCDPRDAAPDEILRVMPHVAHSLLQDGSAWDYRRAWRYGLKHHGLRTLAVLVAAIEGPKKNHPGRWFFDLLKLKSIDVTSNLHALVASREKDAKAVVAAESAKRARAKRAEQSARQAEMARKALAALDEVKASGDIVADDHLWMMVPDHVQIKVDENVVKFAIRPSSRKDQTLTLKSIVKAISERIDGVKSIYDFGSFAGIDSLSAFKSST